MTLKALIFDVDGTLANTEDGHLVSFNKAFKQNNLDWRWDSDLYHDLLFITGGRERIKYYIKTFHPDFKRPNLDSWVAELHTLKTKNLNHMITTGKIKLRLGIKRLLNEVKDAGLILTIATTTTPSNVEALITHNLGKNWLNYFHLIAAGNVVKHKKPAGDIYIYVLKKLGLKPSECLAFEDSENGILSATKAGVRSIITVNSYSKKKHCFDGALIVVSHLGEAEKPFQVISGNALGHQYVDLALVKKLHSAGFNI